MTVRSTLGRPVPAAGFWTAFLLCVLIAGAAFSARGVGAAEDYDPYFPPADIQVNYHFDRGSGNNGAWDLSVRWEGNPRQKGIGFYDWYPAFDNLAKPGKFTVTGTAHESYDIGDTHYEEEATYAYDSDDSHFTFRPDQVTFYTEGGENPRPAFLNLYVPMVVRGTTTITYGDGRTEVVEGERLDAFRFSSEDHPGITGEFEDLGNDHIAIDFSGVDRLIDESEQNHSWEITGGLGDYDPPGLQFQVFDANIQYTSGVPIPLQAAGDLGKLTTHEWLTSARSVSRAAADGVTLLLLRVHLSDSDAGPVTFRVEQGSAEGPLGSLWPVDAASLTDTSAEGGARDQLDGGGPPGEGPAILTVPPVEIDDERWAFAIYRTPRNFDLPGAAADGGLPQRTVKLRASIPRSNGPDSEEEHLFSLVRPLVVFVHGTWDKPGTWEQFPVYQGSQKVVDPNAFWIQDAPSAPFYAGRLSFWEVKDAGGSVLLNARWLLPQISRLLDAWRSSAHVAATQIDVVTHSYGGTSMRYVAQTQSDPNPLTRGAVNYRRLENWGHGYMHKLITLAATHRGSALANHAAKTNKSSGGLLNKLFASQQHPIDQGAGEDQFVLSEAVRAMRQTRVPGHAFIGSGDLEHSGAALQSEVIPFSMGWYFDRPGGPYRRAGIPSPDYLHWDFQALRRLSNYVFNLSHTARTDELGEPNYDLTVSAVSSRGGMPSGAYSTVQDLDVSGLEGKVSHLNQTGNADISRRVQFLLKQSIGSQYFAYFPAPADAAPTTVEKKLSNRSQFDPAWLQIKSVIPLPASAPGAGLAAARRPAPAKPSLTTSAVGGQVSPGDAVQVTLAWPGQQIQSAMVLWPTDNRGGGIQLLSSAKLSFELTVPEVAPGPFPVSAVFATTSGKTEVRSVTLEVTDPDAYQSLRIEPPQLTFASTETASVRVYGQRQDGVWRDVTDSSRTTITSSDPTVATVTPERLVAPRDFGDATLTVAVQNGGQATAPISVTGTTIQVRALAKKLQLRSTKAVGVAFLSGAGFDAQTLTPRTLRVAGARPLSTQIKDVDRDGKMDIVASVRPVDLQGLARGKVILQLLGATGSGTLVGGKVSLTAR